MSLRQHPGCDGEEYWCAILDSFSRMIVARTFSTTADTADQHRGERDVCQQKSLWINIRGRRSRWACPKLYSQGIWEEVLRELVDRMSHRRGAAGGLQ